MPALLAPILLTPTTVQGQESNNPFREVIDISVPIVPRDRVPIALPETLLRSAAKVDPMVEQAAAELHAVVWSDLEHSGVFKMVPRDLYSRVPATTVEKVPYDEWGSIGSRFVALMEVGSASGELVLEGRLFEVQLDRKMVLGKRYQAPFEAVRKLAHTFADAIIEQIGGEPGVCRTKIAFISDRDGQRGREVYVADYDGFGPQRLTSTRTLNMSPDWSWDNSSLVYTSYVRGNPDLFVMPRLGGENRALFTQQGMNTSPAWSPDGKLILFASSYEGADTELYTIQPDGKGLRRLTHNRGIDTNPAWSASGREIAFTSDRSGRPQIYVMDADGLNVRRLTRQGAFNDGAVWAPRGRGTRLAFAGMTGGQFQVFVYTVERDELVQLTDAGSNEAPSWSPDGRQIAFASTRGNQTDIYVMNDDGSNLRRITRGGNNYSPAWSHQ